jgi:hypothetical protein
MNRFMFGRGWVYEDETDGEGAGAGGGAGAGDEGEGAGDGTDGAAGEEGEGAGEGAGEEPGAKKPAEGEPKDMLDAITKGLEKTAPKAEDEAAAAKKAEEEAAAAALAKADKHPNGAPKKDAQGNELDDKGQITKKAEALKAKTAAELDLKPEERKGLGAKAQARFSEVITTLKAREGEIATLTQQMKPLAEARDTITSILEETKTSSDQLSAYLEFNRMLQSDNPKDLEAALGMVEAQRTALYQALGREPEGGGIDLLADFPDLKAKVAEAQITREDALEIAQGRRDKAASEQRTQQQRSQQQSAEQQKQAAQKALADITSWTAELAKSDIDYKAKEEMLLEQVDEVIKTYPPNQWVPTLKLLYAGLVIQKTPAGPDKAKQPIRPSGGKAGAKTPTNMFEAMWGAPAPK